MVEDENGLELILCCLEELAAKVKLAIGHKPVLLDVESAAQYLGLKVSYMNKLRRGNDGPPYIKVGDSVRYHVDDLNEWLRSYKRRGNFGKETQKAEAGS